MTSKFSGLLISLATALVLLLAVEAVLGTWSYVPLAGREVNCASAVVHHDYCPGIVSRRTMAAADGGTIVDTFLDQSALAVATPARMATRTDVASYDVINIGDSFLQADEIAFDQRLAARMGANGVRVLDVGYSSWAPVTMRNWLLAHPPRRGARVNLFTMTNDFMASFSMSNLAYHALASTAPAITRDNRVVFTGPVEAPAQLGLGARLQRQSFFLSRIALVRQRFVSVEPPAAGTPFHDTRFATFGSDCGDLARYHDGTPELLADYLSFARDEACWPRPLRAAVDSATADIRRIADDLDSIGVELHVYLVPAGWAFDGETLVGKASPRHYAMAADVTVTQGGLARHLARALQGLRFTDLEPVIAGLKRGDNERWYFPVDGHWTAHAHRQLADWLLRQHVQ